MRAQVRSNLRRVLIAIVASFLVAITGQLIERVVPICMKFSRGLADREAVTALIALCGRRVVWQRVNNAYAMERLMYIAYQVNEPTQRVGSLHRSTGPTPQFVT